jgi:hypothetical protein
MLGAMVLGVVTAWALAGPAAGAHPIEIEWDVPGACPDESWARAEIESLAGVSLADTQVTQLRFAVSIVRDSADGWAANVVTVTNREKRGRWVTYSDCQAVAEAAALIVAMVIDKAVKEEEATEGEPSGTEAENDGEETELDTAPVAVAEPEPTGPPAVSAPTKRGRLTPWWGGVRAVFDFGVGRLPTVDLGGTLGVTVGGGPLRIEVLGGAWAPRSVSVEGNARAQFYAWSVGARVGGAIGVRRIVEIPILAGFDVGQIRASGRGLAAASEVSPVLSHAHLCPGVTVWVHENVGLLFEADVFVPFVRPTFSVGGRGSVYQALPVGVHGGLGLIVRGPARDNGSRGKRKQ